jgi:hypothetical protein
MYTFSEFANLGDLRQYTLSQIKSVVKKMQFTEYINNGYLYIVFSDKYTKISIEYHLDGCFSRIKSQEVKIPDILSKNTIYVL